MGSGLLFDIGVSARAHHESETQQQLALSILRHRELTKVSFERDCKDGSRLAPAIEMLRNAWGFEIEGSGTTKNPYWMPNRRQYPSKVKVTEQMKDAYYQREEWQRASKQRKEFDNYRCVICTGACQSELHVHHLTYDFLFNERLDCLITVCSLHHKMIHDNSLLRFPNGIKEEYAAILLGVASYEFPGWLLP